MNPRFEFNLKKQNCVLYAGVDAVEGSVNFRNINNRDVNSIIIKFWGRSRTLETYLFLSRRRTMYDATQDIVKDKRFILTDAFLPCGNYTWDFDFRLPADCPTSIESKFGHIRYELYLIVNSKGPLGKSVFIKPITVIHTNDLNMDPFIKFDRDCEKSYECDFQQLYGNITYSIRTPVSAYAPGQQIKYHFEVHNKSPRRIKRFEVRFYRVISTVYEDAFESIRLTRQFLFEKDVPNSSERNQIINGSIYITSTPPTMSADYIAVNYILKIKAITRFFYPKIRAQLQLTIGTVPLRQTVNAQRQTQRIIEPVGFARAENSETFIDYAIEEGNRVDDFLPYYPMFSHLDS